MKIFALILLSYTVTTLGQVVREKLKATYVPQAEAIQIEDNISTLSGIPNTEVLTTYEIRLKELEKNKNAYNCFKDGKGDYISLIPGRCATNGLNSSTPDLNSIVTMSDFNSKSKVPNSAEEMASFYFGNEESCLRCSSVNANQIKAATKKILDKENQLRRKEGAVLLRDMIIKNMIAMRDYDNLSQKQIEKVTCFSRYKKFNKKWSCKEKFYKALEESDSFSVSEGGIPTKGLKEFLYKSVRDNQHVAYEKNMSRLFRVDEIKSHLESKKSDFFEKLSASENSKNFEKYCKNKNNSNFNKLAIVKDAKYLGGFLGAVGGGASGDLCKKYFQSVSEDREMISLFNEIESENYENINESIDKTCEASYDKIESLICDESDNVGPESFKFRKSTNDIAPFFQVIGDVDPETTEGRALKAIACMRHGDLIPAIELQDEEKRTDGDVINTISFESGSDTNTFKDFKYNSNTRSFSYGTESRYNLNSDLGFSLGSSGLSDNGFGLSTFNFADDNSGFISTSDDGLGNKQIYESSDNIFTENSAYNIDNTYNNDNEDYLSRIASEGIFGTTPGTELENSFKDYSSSSNNFNFDGVVSDEVYKSRFLENYEESDKTFSEETIVSEDTTIEEVIDSKDLEKDNAIAELRKEIEALKNKNQKEDALAKAQKEYEDMKAENKRLLEIAEQKKKYSEELKKLNTRSPASVETVVSSDSNISSSRINNTSQSSLGSTSNFKSPQEYNNAFSQGTSSNISGISNVKSLNRENNNKLTAYLKSETSGKQFETNVSGVINSMIKEGRATSNIVIDRDRGVVIFKEQSREIEIEKLSPEFIKDIENYVAAYSKNIKIEDKREEIVSNLDELEKEASILRGDLMKQALYKELSKFDKKWSEKI